MEEDITKEIRMLADAPPSKGFIPRYQNALKYLGDIPDVPEDTTMLDAAAIKALIEERNMDKAKGFEEKLELRRKKVLKQKIMNKMLSAMSGKE
jgi:hypothetical protein